MKCKLCDRSEKLIKAHIIPDFLYEGMFNEHHRLVYTTFPEFSNKSTRPTGIYDRSILCSACDNNLLGKFETYGKNVIKTGRGLIFKKHRIGQDADELRIEDVDYLKFKLFLLSIYFKASISGQEFFKGIKLNAKLENQLKIMLLNSNPGDEDEFPVVILKTKLKYPNLTNAMMAPMKVKFEGKDSGHFFLINGLFYWYCGSVDFQNQIFKKATIKRTNKMSIPIFSGDLGHSLYNKLTGLNIR